MVSVSCRYMHKYHACLKTIKKIRPKTYQRLQSQMNVKQWREKYSSHRGHPPPCAEALQMTKMEENCVPHATHPYQNTLNSTQDPFCPIMHTPPFRYQNSCTHFQYFSIRYLHKRLWRSSVNHSSTTMRQQRSDTYATPRIRKIWRKK